jgi:hypothetical protein
VRGAMSQHVPREYRLFFGGFLLGFLSRRILHARTLTASHLEIAKARQSAASLRTNSTVCDTDSAHVVLNAGEVLTSVHDALNPSHWFVLQHRSDNPCLSMR